MNLSLQVNIPARPARSYPITIGHGLLKLWPEWLPGYSHSKKVVIISDDKVAEIYGCQLSAELRAASYQVALLTFPAGENSKSASSKLLLEEQMLTFGCDRQTLCLALGGGVVGDLAGFTAATFMRGINYIQVPTSLLAMIDSSVGGKTAVNSGYGKNNIGAFWQPQAVIMDLDLLQTLPKDEISNGFFEAIKIFLTLDCDYFEFCQDNLSQILHLESDVLTKVLQRAVALKAHVVEVDEHEKNLRMILNFGHTVGHAIEKLSQFALLHGYAVGLGMLVEAKIAQLSGCLSAAEYQNVAEFLAKLSITSQMLAKYTAADILSAMRGDKKNTNQKIILVLLTAIGQVKNLNNQVAFPVEESIILAALNQLKTV